MRKFNTQYDRPKHAGLKIRSELAEENLTKQAFRDECDINKIMARAVKSGELPLPQRVGQFLDVSEVPDYMTALQIVESAQAAFQQLPAALRAECLNDPEIFLQKVQEPAWAQKHGLLAATPSPAGSSTPAAAGVPSAAVTGGSGSRSESTTGAAGAP